MVKISTQTVRTPKTNREILIAVLILMCVGIVLMCSGILFFLNVKVSSITPTEDFHYYTKVGTQTYDLVPGDVLRIERTPAKKAITGQEIEILKIYTSKGFIFATPDDEYYDGAKKLANSADFYSKPIFMKNEGLTNEVTYNEVRKFAFALGTPENSQVIVFAVLGLQNLAMFVAGIATVLLIFPLRLDKEQDTAHVLARMEQPA